MDRIDLSLITNLSLYTAERVLVEEAMRRGGNIVEAAKLLGITRHALKRRLVKFCIRWERPSSTPGPKPAGGVD